MACFCVTSTKFFQTTKKPNWMNFLFYFTFSDGRRRATPSQYMLEVDPTALVWTHYLQNKLISNTKSSNWINQKPKSDPGGNILCCPRVEILKWKCTRVEERNEGDENLNRLVRAGKTWNFSLCTTAESRGNVRNTRGFLFISGLQTENRENLLPGWRQQRSYCDARAEF